MTTDELAAKLQALPNKRAFATRHELPHRTMWRIISGNANPTARTITVFALALALDKRKRK